VGAGGAGLAAMGVFFLHPAKLIHKAKTATALNSFDVMFRRNLSS
jgi:hypothetical protein